jgi:GDPmannose 4,6-dehydratase
LSEPRAIIVGWPGQDGTLLADLLALRRYGVLCIGRNGTHRFGSVSGPARLDLTDEQQIAATVAAIQPREIYYLAAHHRSAEERAGAIDPRAEVMQSMQVHCVGLLNFLDAIRHHSPQSRIFYAASSLVFADAGPDRRQDELTPLAPQGTYALTKALGVQACREYRELGCFCSVGFLYNHESALRGARFVTQRIARAALSIRSGSQEKLELRELDAVVDWGYAPDYVDACARILELDAPGDFVVATGEGHTVREFVSLAFSHLGLDWTQHVVAGGASLARNRSGRIGEPAKLMRLTGWRPSMSFETMVRRLVDETAARLGNDSHR